MFKKLKEAIQFMWDSKKYILLEFLNKKLDELKPIVAKKLMEMPGMAQETADKWASMIVEDIKTYLNRQL